MECQCPSCGAKFKAPNEYAGRTARCVKCSARFTIPKTGAEKEPVPEDPKAAARAAPAAQGPGKPAGPAKPASAPSAAAGKPAPAPAPGPAPAPIPAPAAAPVTTQTGIAGVGREFFGKVSGRVWIAGAAAVTALVVVIAVVVAMTRSPGSSSSPVAVSQPETPPGAAATSSASVATTPNTPGNPPGAVNLPGAVSNPPAAPGSPPAVNSNPTSNPSPGVSKLPEEKPAAALGPSFDRWLRDMYGAKSRAAVEQKDLFVFFNGSDRAGRSKRLRDEVLSQQEFRQQVDKNFVLVLIDLSGEREKAKVQGPSQNEQLIADFDVMELPSIILADVQGRPYARGGYVEGGVAAFTAQLTRWQGLRKQREELFQAVNASRGAARRTAIKKVLDTLGELRMLRPYQAQFDRWSATAVREDHQNQEGLSEATFEIRWMANCEGMQAWKSVETLAEELEVWTRGHKFKDPDRAAKVHLMAGLMLLLGKDRPTVGKFKEAAKHAELGLKYRCKNPEVSEKLGTVATLGRGAGAGTGFMIAPGGYVLTNRHVIESNREISLQFTGLKTPLSAKLVAEDWDQDIALLKVESPTTVRVEPLPLAAEDVAQGVKVGVLGFPLDSAVGSGPKRVTSTVSAAADQSPQEMMMLDGGTDLGNSGGPLLDVQGSVVGMVAARSLNASGMQCYGTALPASALRAFLKKHLPDFQPGAAADSAATAWDVIDRRAGPSVVKVLAGR